MVVVDISESVGVAQAADLLGLTDRTVHRLIDPGELPARRLGPPVWIDRADVDAYLEQFRVVPGTLPSADYTNSSSRTSRNLDDLLTDS